MGGYIIKSTWFREILEETTIEVDAGFQDTVDRLREQQGCCREEDNSENVLWFLCDKKGKLRVDSLPSGGRHSNVHLRPYYVEGRVVVEKGKTLVKMYAVHDRINRFYRLLDVILYLLILVLYVTMRIVGGGSITMIDVVAVLVFSGIIIMLYVWLGKETKNQTADLEIMKQEIIHRVQAVDRWDE